MDFVEWKDAYSVGNALMDAHHQVFFQMIREFSETPDQDDPDAMMKRIAFLAEYTSMHLAAEEKLMRQANYPGLEQHSATHNVFAGKVQAAKTAFFADQEAISAQDILRMMQDWFIEHILGEDSKYAPYVGQRA